MKDQRNILELAELIYDAAGHAERWPAVVERLVEVFEAATGNIHLRSGSDTLGHFVVGMRPEFARSYIEYYGARNPYLSRAASVMRLGKVYWHEELYPDDAAGKSEFWNDWIVPQKTRYALFGLVLQEHSVVSIVNVVRARSSKEFAQDDIQFLEALMPHLQRALQLHLRIADLEARRHAVADALNHWSIGVILLDPNGRVLLMNRAAESILAANDGISSGREGLHAPRCSDTTILRSLVQDAIETSHGRGLYPGGALLLPRRSLKRALHLLVTPVCANDCLFPHPAAAAAVFVSDPDLVERPRSELLRQLYGLTPAETGVAALLLEGKSLPTIAEELVVTLNTAKTHAKRVYDKTDTRGQADFIRSVLHGPIFLSRSSEKF